jgi:hypothetical protein
VPTMPIVHEVSTESLPRTYNANGGSSISRRRAGYSGSTSVTR